jgi:hypothetical protein
MIHQERIDEIRDQITEKRTAAGYYATVAKVIEKWSGKVYNKRMAEELRAATGGMVFCDKKDNRLHIFYRKTKCGRYPFIQLINIDFEKLENKRVNADLLLSNLRECRERLLKEAQEEENALANLDALIMQIDSIKKTCRALFKNVPYDVLDAIGASRYELRF